LRDRTACPALRCRGAATIFLVTGVVTLAELVFSL